jgi:hypothetical protein
LKKPQGLPIKNLPEVVKAPSKPGHRDLPHADKQVDELPKEPPETDTMERGSQPQKTQEKPTSAVQSYKRESNLLTGIIDKEPYLDPQRESRPDSDAERRRYRARKYWQSGSEDEEDDLPQQPQHKHERPSQEQQNVVDEDQKEQSYGLPGFSNVEDDGDGDSQGSD